MPQASHTPIQRHASGLVKQAECNGQGLMPFSPPVPSSKNTKQVRPGNLQKYPAHPGGATAHGGQVGDQFLAVKRLGQQASASRIQSLAALIQVTPGLQTLADEGGGFPVLFSSSLTRVFKNHVHWPGWVSCHFCRNAA
jgi:hypothetical protein